MITIAAAATPIPRNEGSGATWRSNPVAYPRLSAHEQAGQVSEEDHGQRRRGMATTDTVCAHAPPRAQTIRGSTGSAEETSAFPATVATLYRATRTHAYCSIARRCCSPASSAFIEPTHTATSMTSGQRLASVSENPSITARSRRGGVAEHST
jgi:hypothetical protein